MTSGVTDYYTREDDFWEKYRRGRPQVPESFFERIFSYHASHGGQFDVVHDAGAGAGVHSARLAKQFKKVIVTDVSSSNVDMAKSVLQHSPGDHEFQTVKLEETISTIPPASVDMVFAATMLHFTDIPRSLETIAHQLKPKGTLATFFLGTSVLLDQQADRIWASLYRKGMEQNIRKLGKESMMIPLGVCASAYDAVPLSEDVFEAGALRVKLNESEGGPPGVRYFQNWMPDPFQEEYPQVSKLGANDNVSFEQDEEWFFRKDIKGLKEVLSTFLFDLETEEMKKLWAELEDVVGEREMECRWLVTLIFATRR